MDEINLENPKIGYLSRSPRKYSNFHNCENWSRNVREQLLCFFLYKVHTLDIAVLRSELSPQKRLGIWRVFSFTVLPAHPHVHPQSEWAIPAFAFPAIVFYRPRRDGRLSWPGCEVAPAEIRTCNLPTANPALCRTATIAHHTGYTTAEMIRNQWPHDEDGMACGRRLDPSRVQWHFGYTVTEHQPRSATSITWTK